MIFDKPTHIDLLDAVSYFLKEKIQGEVPPHLAFKLRIVENVLNIVKREIRDGEILSEEIYEDLRKLLDSDSASINDLAELISNGHIDLENDDLKRLLVTLSINKMKIDNPNYSTLKKLVE